MLRIFKLFLIVLPLFLILGLAQGCDKDNGEETTTPTTPTETTPEPSPTPTAAPTCSISPDPQIVRYDETSKLNITITGGPANGSFSPSSGECSSFTDSSGTSCNTASLTTPGENTFTLTVSNAGGTSTCSGKVYVSCEGYRVWNNRGDFGGFRRNGSCSSIPNGAEITTSILRLNKGESILFVGSCGVPILFDPLTYDTAMNRDSKATGGNGNCQVNFVDTDR